MKLKYIIVAIGGGLIISLLIVFIIKSEYYSSYTSFKRVLGIKLPDSASIENYEHHEHLFEENTFYLKISLSEKDYKTVKKDLLEYLDVNGLMQITANDIIPNFQNNCKWWDLCKDDIVFGYAAFQSGKIAKTKYLYVFFTKDKEEQYFMYIAN